jgi:transcription antitermination factor NusG
MEGLKKGDNVRIVSGALSGYEAIFDTALPGKDRVQVLLAYLSDQPKRLQLDASQIKKTRR